MARLIDRPDMTLEFTVDVKQQHNNNKSLPHHWPRTSLPLSQKGTKVIFVCKIAGKHGGVHMFKHAEEST